MPRIRQAIIAPNGATLRPPEARLSSPALLPGRSQLTRPIIGARAGGQFTRENFLENNLENLLENFLEIPYTRKMVENE